MEKTLCRVAFNREVRVRKYLCSTISRSTLIYNKRQRIKKLEKRLHALENKRRRKTETPFLCCIITK